MLVQGGLLSVSTLRCHMQDNRTDMSQKQDACVLVIVNFESNLGPIGVVKIDYTDSHK